MNPSSFGAARSLMPLSLAVLLLAACAPEATSNAPTADSSATALAELTGEVTELQLIDIAEGDGAEASSGQDIVVHYTGWLYDADSPDRKGAKFDSSVDRGLPFVFRLGAGQVIRGWDEGFSGMKTGGKRMLIIPPDFGYGARGAGGAIPPNATLLFEVELLEIR